MTQMIHLLHNQNQRGPRRRRYQPAQVHLKIRGPRRKKVPASTSTPKSKRTKKEKVPASPSTPLKLQHAPTSPFDLNYSPGALTRR